MRTFDANNFIAWLNLFIISNYSIKLHVASPRSCDVHHQSYTANVISRKGEALYFNYTLSDESAELFCIVNRNHQIIKSNSADQASEMKFSTRLIRIRMNIRMSHQAIKFQFDFNFECVLCNYQAQRFNSFFPWTCKYIKIPFQIFSRKAIARNLIKIEMFILKYNPKIVSD